MVESSHAHDGDVFEEVDLFADDAAKQPPAARSDAAPDARDGPAPATSGGGCHVCEEGGGRHTCVSCERAACSAHFWTMYALCTECATEEEIKRLQGHRTGADWRELLGIKWVE